MIKIEDRIKSLEMTQEVTKGKLRKMFEFGENVEQKLGETDDAIENLKKLVDELMRKVNVEIDKLIRLENIVEDLKAQTHSHRVVM